MRAADNSDDGATGGQDTKDTQVQDRLHSCGHSSRCAGRSSLMGVAHGLQNFQWEGICSA